MAAQRPPDSHPRRPSWLCPTLSATPQRRCSRRWVPSFGRNSGIASPSAGPSIGPCRGRLVRACGADKIRPPPLATAAVTRPAARTGCLVRCKCLSDAPRPAVHITTGPLFILTWPLFSNAPSSRYWAAAIPILNGVRLLAIGSGLVNDEGAGAFRKWRCLQARPLRQLQDAAHTRNGRAPMRWQHRCARAFWRRACRTRACRRAVRIM